jgi:hypothetical protein
MPPESNEKVTREILGYLLEHPDAKDTVDGVIKWWLPEDLVDRGKKTVQEVLEILVSRGWLTERNVTSSEKIYGMKKDRLEEIENFLRGA